MISQIIFSVFVVIAIIVFLVIIGFLRIGRNVEKAGDCIREIDEANK